MSTVPKHIVRIMAILLFGGTALIKLWALLQGWRPAGHDPLFAFMPTLFLTILAICIEVAVAVILCHPRCKGFRMPILLWFSLTLLTYKLGVLASGYHGSCPCLAGDILVPWIGHALNDAIPWIVLPLFILVGTLGSARELLHRHLELATRRDVGARSA